MPINRGAEGKLSLSLISSVLKEAGGVFSLKKEAIKNQAQIALTAIALLGISHLSPILPPSSSSFAQSPDNFSSLSQTQLMIKDKVNNIPEEIVIPPQPPQSIPPQPQTPTEKIQIQKPIESQTRPPSQTQPPIETQQQLQPENEDNITVNTSSQQEEVKNQNELSTQEIFKNLIVTDLKEVEKQNINEIKDVYLSQDSQGNLNGIYTLVQFGGADSPYYLFASRMQPDGRFSSFEKLVKFPEVNFSETSYTIRPQSIYANNDGSVNVAGNLNDGHGNIRIFYGKVTPDGQLIDQTNIFPQPYALGMFNEQLRVADVDIITWGPDGVSMFFKYSNNSVIPLPSSFFDYFNVNIRAYRVSNQLKMYGLRTFGGDIGKVTIPNIYNPTQGAEGTLYPIAGSVENYDILWGASNPLRIALTIEGRDLIAVVDPQNIDPYLEDVLFKETWINLGYSSLDHVLFPNPQIPSRLLLVGSTGRDSSSYKLRLKFIDYQEQQPPGVIASSDYIFSGALGVQISPYSRVRVVKLGNKEYAIFKGAFENSIDQSPVPALFLQQINSQTMRFIGDTLFITKGLQEPPPSKVFLPVVSK